MTEEVNYEDLARQEGWVSKDEFRGPDENWVDAETFVKRGQEIAPILSAKNKKLMEELESLKGEVSQIRSASEEFKKVANESIERAKRERDQAIQKLQQVKAEGISEGDGKKVLDAERQIEALRAEDQKAQPKNNNSQDAWNQEAVQWVQQNAWYTPNNSAYDEDKKIYADGVQDIIMSELPHLKSDPKGFFQEMNRRIEKRFEQKNENRERSTVEPPSPGKKGSSSKKSFDNLPDEAKAAFQEMKFLMPSLTEDEYLKNYTWD